MLSKRTTVFIIYLFSGHPFRPSRYPPLRGYLFPAYHRQPTGYLFFEAYRRSFSQISRVTATPRQRYQPFSNPAQLQLFHPFQSFHIFKYLTTRPSSKGQIKDMAALFGEIARANAPENQNILFSSPNTLRYNDMEPRKIRHFFPES